MSEAEENLENEEEQYVPGDVLAGIMYFLTSRFFTGDLRLIHKAIHELRKDFPILRVFPFAVGEVSPFSRRLEDALHRLQLSRVIRMENSDYTRFVVEGSAKNYLENRILPRFEEDELVQLETIAEHFQEKCGEEEPEDSE